MPVNASLRGRAPAAANSSCACLTSLAAPARWASSRPRTSGSRTSPAQHTPQVDERPGLLELRRSNRRGEAREPLMRGLELAHRAGAAGLVKQAQDELAAAGARPRTLAFTGVEALTPSERRVARMAAEGMANKEIAQALFVTVKAVEVHLSSAYRKLQIKSRTQLADAISGPR